MPPQPFSEPVHEYASTNLVTVRPTETLDAVARLLDEHAISGVPVTDEGGALLGIVSTKDVLSAVALEIHPRSPHPIVRSTDRTVAEVMVKAAVTLGWDEPIRRAAQLMVEHRIHRVIVLRRDRLAGIVTTRDVMRSVLRHRITTPLREVMRSPVETIDIGQPVELAVAHLADANVRGLVVVDGEWPVGVFTQREAIHVRALPRDLLSTPVEELMSYEVLCADVGTPIVHVAGQAVAMNVRRVLAVEGRQLRGIATGFDLARIAAG